MARQLNQVLARPLSPKILSAGLLLLPLCLLYFLSVGTRFWVTGKGAISQPRPMTAADLASAEQALTFCRNVLNVQGKVVGISHGKAGLLPFTSVDCTTRRGDYSLLIGQDGEVITAGCEVPKRDDVSSPSVSATGMTQQEAEALARKMTIALQQTPDKITSHRADWQELHRREVQCRCLPRAHAIRTYRIQLDIETGSLTYFNLRIAHTAASDATRSLSSEAK